MIPEGYSTISPYMLVDGAQKVIDFAKSVFDATELRLFRGPNGEIKHAEIKIGNSVVMLADSIEGWPAVPSWVHVYVDDVDATYRKGLAAGGVSAQEPREKEGDPDRRGGLQDPAGNTWWISTPQT